jgi:hypothetical protein
VYILADQHVQPFGSFTPNDKDRPRPVSVPCRFLVASHQKSIDPCTPRLLCRLPSREISIGCWQDGLGLHWQKTPMQGTHSTRTSCRACRSLKLALMGDWPRALCQTSPSGKFHDDAAVHLMLFPLEHNKRNETVSSQPSSPLPGIHAASHRAAILLVIS